MPLNPGDELTRIRSMMERSSRFISLSGLSGVVAGSAALAGVFAAVKYFGALQSFYLHADKIYDPAGAFASFIGVTNLNFFSLVPVGCVFSEVTFYTKLLVKTIGPIVPLVLLWARPVGHIFTGNRARREQSSLFAAKFSLLWLELVLTSVSTTIVETFVCSEFDDGAFLAAQMTIACDGSPRRVSWMIYSWCALFIYPFGVPCLLYCLLFVNRHDIKRVLQTLREDDDNKSSRGEVGGSMTIEEMALRLKSRKRKSSFVSRSEKHKWLTTKLDIYLPAAWWIHPALLVLRITQTSMLALFRTRQILVSCSSCINILGVCLLKEASPHRRPSE